MARKEKNKELKEAGFSANRHCYTCGAVVAEDSHFCPGDDAHFVGRLLNNPESAPFIREAIRINVAPWVAVA